MLSLKAVIFVALCWLQCPPLALGTDPLKDMVCNTEGTHSCTHHTSSFYPLRGCMCDALCSEFGDCCFDSEFFTPAEQEIAAADYRCVAAKDEAGRYVKVSCASTWVDEEVEQLCRAAAPEAFEFLLDPLSHVPVTSTATGVDYANYYCAVCNNDAEDISFWNVSVRCLEDEDSFLLDNTYQLGFQGGRWEVAALPGKCAFSLVSDSWGRECHRSVRDCHWLFSNTDVERFCKSYISVIKFDGILYRNFFCAKCNHATYAPGVCNSDLFYNHYNYSAENIITIESRCQGSGGGTEESCDVFDPFLQENRSLRSGTRPSLVVPKDFECSQIPSHSCKKSVSSGERHCKCDVMCARYGDCCHDSDYFDPVEQMAASHRYRCISADLSRNVYVLASCAPDWRDEQIAHLCETASEEDPLTRVPFVSNTSDVVYANVYCTFCNYEDIQFWQGNFDCIETEEGEELSITDALQNCTVSLPLKLRECESVIDSCPADWPDDRVRVLCQTVHSTVVDDQGNIFRNSFCAACNNVTNVRCDFSLPAPASPNSISMFFDFFCETGGNKVNVKCGTSKNDQQNAGNPSSLLFPSK